MSNLKKSLGLMLLLGNACIAQAALRYDFVGQATLDIDKNGVRDVVPVTFSYLLETPLLADYSVPVDNMLSCSTAYRACVGVDVHVDAMASGHSGVPGEMVFLFDWGSGGPIFYFDQLALWKPGVYDTTLQTFNAPSTLTVSSVPEPATWGFMGLGLLMLGGYRRVLKGE
ncbi:PEP-CTERM sorting domain-containing protein [Roseateles toxinivorans]|uniref:Putative secreted protein with PEP-CTERM sorting signal n=1 Tax=Roseateles toxinivorans TaxID=270368 RepID=A0A4R6QIX2_9BURK|nr:PEP-CTERM sorting domain-containing protein [Roseateles toxinivorans]TDP61608.1 putative secreted protein with PEP-CTERM sorting signal [Roseateles toxinivorans]